MAAFIAALLAALAAASAVAAANATGAPHIVYVLADDLGWNDVSYHGSAQFATPHIDALAASGVTLDAFYVNPTCSPTRASLLSGRALAHHGIYIPFGSLDTAAGLNRSYTLLPEHLQVGDIGEEGGGGTSGVWWVPS